MVQRRLLVPVGSFLAALWLAASPAPAGDLTVMTRDSGGTPVATSRKRAFISGNGRFVVFAGGPLLPEDTSVTGSQVYLRDLLTGELELVSVNHVDGGHVNAAVDLPPFSNARAVSDDGRYVVFRTVATDVVDGVGNGVLRHIYRRDRQTDTTVVVDVTNDSGGGSELGNGTTDEFTLDPTGTVVAFNSYSSNLDTTLDGSTNRNTFLHLPDAAPAAWTQLACFQSDDSPVNDCTEMALSSGGGAMVFKSGTSNVVAGVSGTHLYWANPLTDAGNEVLTVDHEDAPQSGNHGSPSIAAAGNRVAFPSSVQLSSADDDSDWDLYVRDVVIGDTYLVLGAGDTSTRAQGAAAISSGGGVVAFQAHTSLDALDLNSSPDVYRLDWSDPILPGAIEYASTNRAGTAGSNLGAENPTVADLGGVAFFSNSTNLVPGVGANHVYAEGFSLFTDGFESGDTTRWSDTLPPP